MLIFGHRGAAGLAPENTLSSFREALRLGVDGIEFDVRCSRDHVPVVIHDQLVDRTTDGTGGVSQFNVAELQALSIGESERIPTLTEVLSTIGLKAQINIELKEIDAAEPTWEALQRSVATGTVDLSQVLVTSFDSSAVRLFRHLSQEVTLGLLVKGPPSPPYWDLATELNVVSANIDLASVSEDFVRKASDRNLRVMVYTVNSTTAADKMRELGIDAIFTDFPDKFCKPA